jgi:hypothetical protein
MAFYLRAHCTWQVRGRYFVGVCTFLALAKKVPKKRAGASPLDPAPPQAARRKPLRCSASLRKARLEVLGKCKLAVLFGTASKTGWADGADSLSRASDNSFF